MRYSFVATAAGLAGVVSAIPQGGSSTLAPSGANPAGCKSTFSGTFQIRAVLAPGPTLTKRATCSSEGTLIASLENGILTDSHGRLGSIVANHQFQFDGPPAQAGTIYDAGWAVCADGFLALGSSEIFYQCKSGDFFNFYDKSIGAQCQKVMIEVLPCHDSWSHPGSHTSSGSSSQISDGQIQTGVNQIADGQIQNGGQVSQISDGQIQNGGQVSQISDGQIQAGGQVGQISDGQIQTGGQVSQIKDGQLQTSCTSGAANQVPDGQIQNGGSVSQICDGQIQTITTEHVSEIHDGQIQNGGVGQIVDGQIQARDAVKVIEMVTEVDVVKQKPDGEIVFPSASEVANVAPATNTGVVERRAASAASVGKVSKVASFAFGALAVAVLYMA